MNKINNHDEDWNTFQLKKSFYRFGYFDICEEMQPENLILKKTVNTKDSNEK